MSFELKSHEVDPETQLIAVFGETDLYTAPELKTRLHEAIDGGKIRLVVDFSEAPFIDSTGLGVLVSALKRLRGEGGALVLVSANENMRRLFRATGLDQAMPLFETREEGLAAVGEGRE